ncbi:DNA-binding transcriptional LysR family regulator [Duganella sp. SG902]|uniref:LysR substrate-binding domain-containing protein n=1 Tax=Duganella sp. SG902 TaxID=2587016 RepID=UPI00159D86A9|nr:LysR substrate-binding domain-containing protein [Duganella sp. SG902]NVM78602.1 DNA-binding transcriptional LysR family regulator [Duganella sp. SG902]
MSDKLRSMEVFVAAATAGSFAAAAQTLEISAVMVGKHVQALEQQLGARLIERSTRRQTLTEIGAAYLERCRDVLASVDAADHVAENLRAEPQGSLRISAPATYGEQRLTPVIAAYTARYPKVRVDLVLSNRVIDMAEEGVDVTIRSGPITDTALIARPLQPGRVLVAASPAYLKKHGTPRHPSDLERHNCLVFAGGATTWRFQRGEEKVAVNARGTLVSNTGASLVIAAIAGMGVVMQADVLMEPALKAGELVRLLPKWELPSRAMHILRRPEARPSAKVRSFVDFALERLG